MLSKRLLAALALIVVHSIYMEKVGQASAAPLIMRMHKLSGGVAYER